VDGNCSESNGGLEVGLIVLWGLEGNNYE
jgi:hypothetical protein